MTGPVSASDFTMDESQIKSLLKRERYYRDTCQFKKMRDTYHPDNSRTFVNISWYEGNIEGFISATEKVTHNKITTLHMIDPIEIEIRGPKALSESLCQITTRYMLEGLEYDKVTTCRLMSRLEKVEGAWKILTLEPIYIRDSMIATAPQSPDTIPTFKGAEKYPKSYRYGAWLLESIGIQSKLDLPNEDDRESVKKIIDANEEWLDRA